MSLFKSGEKKPALCSMEDFHFTDSQYTSIPIKKSFNNNFKRLNYYVIIRHESDFSQNVINYI